VERDEILQLFEQHRIELQRFGVKSIALFGSIANNTAREHSDVDVLVEFGEPVGLFEFVRLKIYLEELCGRPVDLVTADALKATMREQVLREAVYAA